MDEISVLEWYAVGVLDGLHGKQEGIKGHEYSFLTTDPISYYSYNNGWWDGRKDLIETAIPLYLNNFYKTLSRLNYHNNITRQVVFDMENPVP